MFDGCPIPTDGHRLSDYAIGPEAKLNLVVRQTGEKTGALAVGSSSHSQDRVWQIVSSILARHFSPADASKVLEHLIKVLQWLLLNTVRPSSIRWNRRPRAHVTIQQLQWSRCERLELPRQLGRSNAKRHDLHKHSNQPLRAVQCHQSALLSNLNFTVTELMC